MRHVPGAGRRVAGYRREAEQPSIVAPCLGRMKIIQSRTVDVFFCHSSFSWSERGFQTVITRPLRRQGGGLYRGAWEAGAVGQVTLLTG